MQLTPISDPDWPSEIADMKDGFAGRLNVYRVMAHHPDLLRAWAPLREHVVRKSALGEALSEVVIIRVGARLGSVYEWTHHVARARKIGMSDTRIRSLRGDPAQMDAMDALVVEGVDDIIDHARLLPETRDRLTEALGVQATFDVIATAGFYRILATLLETFEVPVDDEVKSELTRRPID